MALQLKPKYQMILFDDVGGVTLQGEQVFNGQMEVGCQVWPWLLVVKLKNEQQAFRLLVYADGISNQGYRRLARVINLNRFSYP